MTKGFVIPTTFGELRDASDALDADAIFDLKKKAMLGADDGTHTVTIWDVIDRIITVWVNKHPQVWKSYLVELGAIKATRADAVFGKSKESVKYHGDRGNIRYTIDMPEPIYKMIRCVYNDEELPMNREFFQEFGKRFKQFAVAQKQ